MDAKKTDSFRNEEFLNRCVVYWKTGAAREEPKEIPARDLVGDSIHVSLLMTEDEVVSNSGYDLDEELACL